MEAKKRKYSSQTDSGGSRGRSSSSKNSAEKTSIDINEDENDVLWAEQEINQPSSHHSELVTIFDDTSQSASNDSIMGISKGSNRTRRRLNREDITAISNPQKTEALERLMQSILNEINNSTNGNNVKNVATDQSQTIVNSQGDQVQPIISQIIGAESMRIGGGKDVEDFSEEDFAELERAVKEYLYSKNGSSGNHLTNSSNHIKNSSTIPLTQPNRQPLTHVNTNSISFVNHDQMIKTSCFSSDPNKNYSLQNHSVNMAVNHHNLPNQSSSSRSENIRKNSHESTITDISSSQATIHRRHTSSSTNSTEQSNSYITKPINIPASNIPLHHNTKSQYQPKLSKTISNPLLVNSHPRSNQSSSLFSKVIANNPPQQLIRPASCPTVTPKQSSQQLAKPGPHLPNTNNRSLQNLSQPTPRPIMANAFSQYHQSNLSLDIPKSSSEKPSKASSKISSNQSFQTKQSIVPAVQKPVSNDKNVIQPQMTGIRIDSQDISRAQLCNPTNSQTGNTQYEVEIVSPEEMAFFDALDLQYSSSYATLASTYMKSDDIQKNKIFSKQKNESSDNLNNSPFIRCHQLVARSIEKVHSTGYLKVSCSDISGHDEDGIEPSLLSTTLELQGDWSDTDIQIGDEIVAVELLLADFKISESTKNHHVNDKIEEIQSTSHIVITNDFGLIILQPRTLVSPTRIAEACSCLRRCVVSEKTKSLRSFSSPAAVLGNLKHSFIESLASVVIKDLIVSRHFQTRTIKDPTIRLLVREAIGGNISDLHSVGISDERATFELLQLVPHVSSWAYQSFVNGYPSSSGSDLKTTCNIENIECAEEVVWSPILGLKGKIDIIAKGVMSYISQTPSSNMANMFQQNTVAVSFPVELKTGRWKSSQVSSHRAQWPASPLTPPLSGILLYLNDFETKVELVSPDWGEIRALITTRNALAQHLRTPEPSLKNKTSVKFPPMLASPRDCGYCFQASECMTYHAALERGTTVSSGAPDLFNYVLRDISPLHLSYLRHWEGLLDLEEEAIMNRQIVWKTKKGYKNWNHGLIAESCTSAISNKDLNISKSSFHLVLKPRSDKDDILNMCKNLDIGVGDRVIVNGEKTGIIKSTIPDIEDMCIGHTQSYSPELHQQTKSIYGRAQEPRLATGTIIDITENTINLIVNEYPRRLMEISKFAGCTFTLESSEAVVALPTMRSCLMSLMADPHDSKAFEHWKKTGTSLSGEQKLTGKGKLRTLVVDLIAPSFEQCNQLTREEDILMFVPSGYTIGSFQKVIHLLNTYSAALSIAADTAKKQSKEQYVKVAPTDLISGEPAAVIRVGRQCEYYLPMGLIIYPGCNPVNLLKEFNGCNHDQQLAVRKTLLAQDYALIHGFPGTGKSNTTSLIIRAFVARGLRVLVSSYTHSAVDNIMLKLQAAGVTPGLTARLGFSESVHSDIRPYLVEPNNLESLVELDNMKNNTRIVACTALTAIRDSTIFTWKFDWCVIDEAGQILEPITVGAISTADRFLLVGDPYQLPPLVVSPEAKAGGMDISLMKRLSDSHPEVVSHLTLQYRMNSDILSICNSLYYDHRMKCANDDVSNLKLQLLSNWQDLIPKSDWLSISLDPANSVVFLDTSRVIEMRNIGYYKDIVSSVGNKLNNTENCLETEIIFKIMESMIICGIDSTSIGIISPFRAQLSALLHRFQNTSSDSKSTTESFAPCEISTIDKYQGRDKDVVIFSTIHSSPHQGFKQLFSH